MEFETGNRVSRLIGNVFRRLANYFVFAVITLFLDSLLFVVFYAYFTGGAAV